MDSEASNVALLRDMVSQQIWSPAEKSPFHWAMSLMPNLRESDPELRDTLTYRILVELFMAHMLSAEEVAVLLDWAVSRDYLFYRIGDTDTDSVFARSFGVLIVAAIVEVDAADPRLSLSQIGRVIDAVVTYAHAEVDHRGVVEGKGWAHAVAHAADALASCAQHPYATAGQRGTILDAVAHLAGLASPFLHGEDDRLAFVVLHLAKGDFSDIEWGRWLAGFRVTTRVNAAQDLRAMNMGHFLRAVLVMVHEELPTWAHMDALWAQIRGIHGFYRSGTLPLP